MHLFYLAVPKLLFQVLWVELLKPGAGVMGTLESAVTGLKSSTLLAADL